MKRLRLLVNFTGPDRVPGYGSDASTANAVHWLLADALGEFARSRGTSQADRLAYIAARYRHLSTEEQAAKLLEVEARVNLADALRAAINEANPAAIVELLTCGSPWCVGHEDIDGEVCDPPKESKS